MKSQLIELNWTGVELTTFSLTLLVDVTQGCILHLKIHEINPWSLTHWNCCVCVGGGGGGWAVRSCVSVCSATARHPDSIEHRQLDTLTNLYMCVCQTPPQPKHHQHQHHLCEGSHLILPLTSHMRHGVKKTRNRPNQRIWGDSQLYPASDPR